MVTYRKESLNEIIRKHAQWLRSEPDGERADLSYADLSNADLSNADLSNADLSYIDLSYIDLSYARSFNGTQGDMVHIKSLQICGWPVTYTATHLQVGCQLHPITDWWAFDADRIEKMDSQATKWWAIWKPILQTIIAASPANPQELAK